MKHWVTRMGAEWTGSIRLLPSLIWRLDVLTICYVRHLLLQKFHQDCSVRLGRSLVDVTLREARFLQVEWVPRSVSNST